MQFALSLILTCGLICNGFFFTKVSGFQVSSVLQILGSKQLPPLLNKFWVMGITDSRALPMDLVWGDPLMLGLTILRTEGGDEGRALPLDLVWGDPWCWSFQFSEPRVEMKVELCQWIWYEGTPDVGAYNTQNWGWRLKVLGTEGAAWGPRCNALLERLGSWEVLGTEGGARGGPKCKKKKRPTQVIEFYWTFRVPCQ